MCGGACPIIQIHTEAVECGSHFSCVAAVQNTFSAQTAKVLSNHRQVLLEMHSPHILAIALGQYGKNSQKQRVPHNKPDTSIHVSKEISS